MPPKKRKNISQRPPKLVARGLLSNYKVTRIIECFGKWMPVEKCARQTLVSHVTVARIYMLIRKRLLAVGVYEPLQSYLEWQYDLENDEDEGYRFNTDAFHRSIRNILARYGGIGRPYRHLYEAEALFRHTHQRMSYHDVVAIIQNVIRETGPLGATPRGSLSTLRASEFRRRRANQWRSTLKQLGMDEALGVIDRAEALEDRVAKVLGRE